MSSSEEKPLPLPLTNEDTTTAQSDSSKPKKLTTVIGVLLIVGVVATVGVCVAVFAPAKHNNEMKGEDTQGGDLQVKEQLYGKVADNAKLAKRARRRRPSSDAPCSSSISSDTIPAAHIQGRGQFTTERQSDTVIPGYQSQWTCSERSGRAFVDGGMVFNHSDKALHVPKCGYYYVSSQVYFHVTRESLETQPSQRRSTAVNHDIRVAPNCNGDSRSSYLVAGYSSLGPFRSSNGQNNRREKDFVETSSYVGEIFKLCTGGKIWVEIPESNPCCPRGTPSWVTFLGAFLVSETNCNWPPGN